MSVGVIPMHFKELGLRVVHENVKEEDEKVRGEGAALSDPRTLSKLVGRVNSFHNGKPGILVDVPHDAHNMLRETGPTKRRQQPGV